MSVQSSTIIVPVTALVLHSCKWAHIYIAWHSSQMWSSNYVSLEQQLHKDLSAFYTKQFYQ